MIVFLTNPISLIIINFYFNRLCNNLWKTEYLTNIYLFKINNRSTRKKRDYMFKDTVEVNDIVLVSLLLTLNIFQTFSSVSKITLNRQIFTGLVM